MKTLTTIFELNTNEMADLLAFIEIQFGIAEVNKITTNDDGDILIWGTHQEDKVQESIDHFLEFANKHNKKHKAREILEGINELTKEASKFGIELS